ncbi:phage baseplate assembly protein V [Burkholderia sp. FERM BP-3421]|jgi:phage baseplate assembly protein V|uniref:phage baseplate assembly protein V n=1 Tax=Burkholderia sp. FERM BP-3421 TaxID=1494466 RepID=UPI00236280C1|nr:phage baseplate assembly protein V [Burkholderia sp. FERM BP-3421]WDD95934.1 phage baseplate assembly protein V [Burkholderia sp. FERM BP-3421]
MNDRNESTRLMLNQIRRGSIMAVDHARALCRFQSGELQTDWLSWLTPAAGTTREWLPPTVGEQAVLLSESGDPAQGVVLRGVFSDAAGAPGDSPDTHTRVYPDGARIDYNHAAHALTAELPAGATLTVIAPGSVEVRTRAATLKAETVTIDAGATTVTGSLLVQGAFEFQAGMTGKGGGGGATMRIDGAAEFSGDVRAQGKSLPGHTHRAQGENAVTSPPL